MKQGVRVINCARGGLVDERALYEAIKSGIVAGAALTFSTRNRLPATILCLLLDEIIVTPHLGASTTEAQEGVAFTVAEQMRDYLLNRRFARRGKRCQRSARRSWPRLQPYIELGEKLGRFQAQLRQRGDEKSSSSLQAKWSS